jgi:hypothetical protein
LIDILLNIVDNLLDFEQFAALLGSFGPLSGLAAMFFKTDPSLNFLLRLIANMASLQTHELFFLVFGIGIGILLKEGA